MAIYSPSQENMVTELTIVMFGAAPGGFKSYLMDKSVNSDATATAQAFAQEPAFAALQNAAGDQAALMTERFGLDQNDGGAGAMAYSFFQSALAADDSMANVAALYAAGVDYVMNSGDAAFSDAKDWLENKVELATIYTDSEGAGVTNLESLQDVLDAEGLEFNLTSGTDIFTQGSYGDDTFTAGLAQNQLAGGVSNSLSTADRLDGGAGNDTLNATLVSEFVGATTGYNIDVQPTTSNIENVFIEALDYSYNTQPVEGNADDENTVTVDAKKMTGIEKIGSSYSDGDLVIENLTTLDDNGNIRNTQDITIVMDHTDNFNSDGDASDLTVYFDEDYLVAGNQTTESAVGFYMLDENTADYVNTPLENIERTGVKFTLEGVEYSITMGFSEAAAANDWATYAAELQESLAELQDPSNADYAEELVGLSFVHDTGNQYFPQDSTYNDQGVQVSIDPIVLVDANGRAIDGSGFITPEDATGKFDIYGSWDNEPSTTENLPVTVNAELEKVGRDGEGGNLIIGGKDQNSQSDDEEDQQDGINVINVDVRGDEDKPSYLGVLSSTDQTLTTVNIESADTTLDTFASLTIADAFNGGGNTSNTTNVQTVNATNMMGDLTIGTGSAMLNVNTFNGSSTANNTVTAAITGTEKGSFAMNTGSGEDTMNVRLDGDAVDTVNTAFSMTTGGGADSVSVQMDSVSEAGVSQATMADLQNLSISTGSGADSVDLLGYGNFHISTGNESDFVRINSGADSSGDATTGTWVTGDIGGTGATLWEDRVLYEASLTVNFAGFEQQVDIPTDSNGNFIADQIMINDAIKNAIDTNSELSRLLEYSDGTGSQELTITSTVEGDNDFTISVNQPTVIDTGTPTATQVLLNANDIDALEAGFIATSGSAYLGTNNVDSDTIDQTAGDGGAADVVDVFDGSSPDVPATIQGNIQNDGTQGATDFYATGVGTDGTDETTVSNASTINLGSGTNDLVALNSDDNSPNTVEFTEAWGKVSIVNFFDDQAGTVGNHILDFNAWLDDQSSTSTSAESAVLIDGGAADSTVELAASIDLTANEVAIVNDFAEAGTDNWADMTAADLDAALSDAPGDQSNDYANITTGAITTATNLYGDTQDSIVMIENDNNVGEYKVFNVETDTTAAANAAEEFVVSYLGVIDFGASIDAATAVA